MPAKVTILGFFAHHKRRRLLPLSLSLFVSFVFAPNPRKLSRYDKFYHKQDSEGFVRDFLSSPDVQREILGSSSTSDAAAPKVEVASFVARPVKATVTSMDFFDKLLETDGVVRSNGQLVKCMDDYYEVSSSAAAPAATMALRSFSPSHSSALSRHRRDPEPRLCCLLSRASTSKTGSGRSS